MPPLPAAPGVLRVTHHFVAGPDATALCRYYLHYSGAAPTDANLASAATGIDAQWGTYLKPLSTSEIVMDGTNIEDLSSSTGAVGSDSSVTTGSRAGHSLPASAAAMVQFQIARRYRGGKPKIFLPAGASEDIANPDVWSSTFTAAVLTGWTDYLNAVLAFTTLGGGTITHVNVSYYEGFTVVTNPVTHRARNVPTLRPAPVVDPVLGYTVGIPIATQRRRNR